MNGIPSHLLGVPSPLRRWQLIVIASFVTTLLLTMDAPAFASHTPVTNTNDGGAGSLRQAIIDASSGETIDVTGVSGTILLTSGQIVITKSLTINGPGAATLTIDGDASSRIFSVNGGVTVSISGLTITNGSASPGGAIFNLGVLTITNSTISDSSGTTRGGGIYNSGGTLNLSGSIISGNTATGGTTRGGGIWNSGTATITNSTISGNTAQGSTSDGAGLWNSGTMTVTNSTISNNTGQFGTGIRNAEGTLTVTNSTISGNGASGGGDAVSPGIDTNGGIVILISSTIAENRANQFGSIRNWGTSSAGSITNTILDGITAAVECGGGFLLPSLGHNLSEDGSCGFTATGDLQNTDPLLGPLADNGGPTFTHELLTGSPAIDAGDKDAAPVTDQRGISRPQGSQSDIGAFEVSVAAPAADLSIAKSANPASVGAAQNLTYTLTVTNGGPDTASGITVTDTLPGSVTFVSASAGCSESGGTVPCTASSLANAANVQFTITVTAPGALGTISNTASVASSTTDPTSSNDSVTLVTTVIPAPAVPGLTTWGLGALAFALGALVLMERRRRAASLR